MIRSTLPDDLREYYNDLDNVFWDFDKVEVLEKKKGLFGLYTRYLYKLPDAYEVLGKKDDIYIYHYSKGKKRPTIICAPILGGKMKLKDNKWSGNFPIAMINAWVFVVCKGWNALIVCTNNKGLFTDGDTPENFELSLKNVAYNNIQALQYIKTLPETDDDKIYALGVSLGALTMIAMAGIEDSIQAVVGILGGGPLAKVISVSTEGSVRKFFARLQENLNVDADQAQQALMVAIKTDTVRLGYYVPDGTAYMILAEGDTSVDTKCQYILLDAVEPKDHFVNKMPKYFGWLAWFKDKPGFLDKISQGSNGHYLTILLYPYLLYKTIAFFHDVRH